MTSTQQPSGTGFLNLRMSKYQLNNRCSQCKGLSLPKPQLSSLWNAEELCSSSCEVKTIFKTAMRTHCELFNTSVLAKLSKWELPLRSSSHHSTCRVSRRDTYTERQRMHVLRCVLCSMTRIFGVSLSLSAIMSSIDSNVTLQTDWVLTPMTESC